MRNCCTLFLARGLAAALALLIVGRASLSAAAATTTNYKNPFGLLSQKGDGEFIEVLDPVSGGYVPPPEGKMNPTKSRYAAENLSTPVKRMSIQLNAWYNQIWPTVYTATEDINGNSYATQRNQTQSYFQYVAWGHRMMLNISYGANHDPQPTGAELADFKAAVAWMMTKLHDSTDSAITGGINLNGYNGTPEIIVVFNEETRSDVTGDHNGDDVQIASYLQQLAAVADVVKNGYSGTVHGLAIQYLPTGPRPNIGVANGGITEQYFKTLIWDWYKNTLNDAAKAADFAGRYMKSATSPAIPPPLVNAAGTALTTDGTERLTKAKKFMGETAVTGAVGYKDIGAMMDYINFHWYGPNPDEGRTTDSPSTKLAPGAVNQLDDIKAYFAAKLPGKILMTSEIGSNQSRLPAGEGQAMTTASENAATDAVNAILAKAHDQIGLAYIVWYLGREDPYLTTNVNTPAHTERYISLTDSKTPVSADGYDDFKYGPHVSSTTPVFDGGVNKQGQAFRNFVVADKNAAIPRYLANYWTDKTGNGRNDTEPFDPSALPVVTTTLTDQVAIGTSLTPNLSVTSAQTTSPWQIRWYAAHTTNLGWSVVNSPTTSSSHTTTTAGTYVADVRNPAGGTLMRFMLWNDTTIGTVTVPSGSGYASGVYTLKATDGNIGGASPTGQHDNFHWFNQLARDATNPPITIVAKVQFKQTGTLNLNAMAGLMIRGTSGTPADNRKNIFIGSQAYFQSGANKKLQIVAQCRVDPAPGDTTTLAISAPIQDWISAVWLKLSWNADGSFSYYGKEDAGETAPPVSGWSLLGTTSAVAITTSNPTIGLAAANLGATSTVEFSNVSITSP